MNMRGYADFEQLILDAKMVVGIDNFTRPWKHPKPLEFEGAVRVDEQQGNVLENNIAVSCGILGANEKWSIFERLEFFYDRTEVVSTFGHVILDRTVFLDSEEELRQERWGIIWGAVGFNALTPKHTNPVTTRSLDEQSQIDLYQAIERPLLAARDIQQV